jgi:GNAT superfamily N-acetyltransferase
MNTDLSLRLRPLQERDLPDAHRLSQAVGWPHRLPDWQTLFSMGQGVAAVDTDDAMQGVALWWLFGSELATLGMVIVSPAVQRCGLGRRLLEAILGAVDRRRVLLHATVSGLRLYESFGFVAKGEVRVHQGTIGRDVVPAEADALIRPLTVDDRMSVRALDGRATGADRGVLLTVLETSAEGLVAERNGTLCGYALCRDFGRGKIIGPLVADSESTAIALGSAAAVQAGGFVRVDIPETASALAAWLEGAGLPNVSRVRTMWRGHPLGGDATIKVFSLAAQAVG